MRRLLRRIAAAMSVAACGLPAACNLVPSRNPTGERLPPAEGKTLAGEPVTLEGALAGQPAVLLLPYSTDAQLDADRWALALHQLGTPVARFELGVVPSTFGVLAAPAIDLDRRKKRAEVAWPTVLCFYSDGADALATQTGMGRPEYARVMLVDRERTIVWYCDQGFTPERCAELDAEVRTLSVD